MTDPAPSPAAAGARSDVPLAVPRRFGDMDALAHVNNVRYLDYLEQGRAAWITTRGLPGGARVVGHRLAFDAPMVFGRADAEVRTWLVGVAAGRLHLAQTITSSGHHGDEPPTVHLRAETWLAVPDAGVGDEAGEGHSWREVAAAEREPRHRHVADVRRRDLGPDGAVRDDAVVEWFQEARVRYFMDLHQLGEEWGQVVIARTDVDLAEDLPPGLVREVRSWIAHVGSTSFTVRADLVSPDDRVLARSTVVAVRVDAATGRPAPLTEEHRARLEAELDRPGLGLSARRGRPSC